MKMIKEKEDCCACSLGLYRPNTVLRKYLLTNDDQTRFANMKPNTTRTHQSTLFQSSCLIDQSLLAQDQCAGLAMVCKSETVRTSKDNLESHSTNAHQPRSARHVVSSSSGSTHARRWMARYQEPSCSMPSGTVSSWTLSTAAYASNAADWL